MHDPLHPAQEDRADQAVVTETVLGADREHRVLRPVEQITQVRRGQPAGRGVELVRPQGELADPRHVGLPGHPQPHHDLQAAQVLLDRGEALLEVAAVEFLPVAPHPDTVLGGQLPGVEPSVTQHRVQVTGGVLVDRDHGDVGQFGPDEAALVGGVVDEDEAVDPEVERAGKVQEVLVLGPPVGDDPHEVVRAQRHLRMPGERVAHHVGLVLADRGEQHALRPDLLHDLLHGPERLTPVGAGDLDTLHPVVTDDPAPQGVVQVEHQGLAGAPGDVAGEVADLPGVGGEQAGGQVGLGVDRQPGVGDRHALGDERVQIEHHQRGKAFGEAEQPGVRPSPHRPQPGPRPMVDELGGEPAWQRQRVEHQGSPADLGEAGDQRLEQGDLGIQDPFDRVGIPRERHLVEDDRRVEQGQDEIGRMGVQGAAGIGELEHVTVEGPQLGTQQQTVPAEFPGQGRQQRGDRAVRGDGDPHDRGRRMLPQHLVRADLDEQAPRPRQFLRGGVRQQLADPGELGGYPAVTVQAEQVGGGPPAVGGCRGNAGGGPRGTGGAGDRHRRDLSQEWIGVDPRAEFANRRDRPRTVRTLSECQPNAIRTSRPHSQIIRTATKAGTKVPLVL